MILACDMDSVICDGTPALDRINARCGTTFGPADVVQYPLEPFLQDCVEDPGAWLTALFVDPEYLRELPPILPMLTTLRKVTALFDGLHIITARPEATRDVTRLWLDRYGVPYDKLVMTRNKAEYCRQVGAGYIIEDAPHHALECHSYGIGVFLLDMPYNRDVPDLGGLWRVSNPLEIIPIVKNDLAKAG